MKVVNANPQSANICHTAPQHLRTAALVAAALALIVSPILIAPHCDARDVNTINGRRLCPSPCTTADVRRAWHDASNRAQVRAAHRYYARPVERGSMFKANTSLNPGNR